MRMVSNRGIYGLVVVFLSLSAQQVYGQNTLNVLPASGTPSPLPACVGDTIGTVLTGTVTNPPTASYPCVLNKPVWVWSKVSVQYSPDNNTWSESPGGDMEMISQPDTDYAGADLTASFNTGGYWKVTLQLSLSYSDSCGNTWSGSGTLTIAMGPVIQVTILRQPDSGGGYQAIAGANANALPGQYIDLQAQVKPAGLAVTYQWKIPQYVFASYTVGDNQATLTRVAEGAYNNQTIQFYWANAGNKQVSCQVTSGQKMCTGNATINVQAPTIDFTANQTGTSQITNNYLLAGTWLTLFNPTGRAGVNRAGIYFNCTVQVPAGFAQGKWQYGQVLTSTDTRTKVGGAKEHWSLNGTLVLDDPYPYGPASNPPYNTGAMATSVNDSPGSQLDNTKVTAVGANDSFTMYVMFLPPGAPGKSQWVPLKYINWGWKGSASWDGAKWVPAGLGENVDPASSNPNYGNANMGFPVWTAINSGGNWIPG
jgi:hypothetical protein